MSLVALLAVLGVGLGAYAAFAASPPPAPSITAAPANPTNQTSASFTYTDSGTITKFQCNLDAAGWVDCGTTKPSTKPYAGLPAGSHSFQVRAVSNSGTSSATSYGWTVDLTPPSAPVISTKPSDPSDNRSPSFGFTGVETGEMFLCSLDGSAFTACSNPVSYSSLAIGTHTLRVEGKDAAGNISTGWSSYGWTIVPPAPSITAKPSNPTAQATASFSFTDSLAGATFVCSLDGALPFGACTSPKPYSGLVEGTHTFQVKAVSGSFQSAATSYSWRIDTSPPAITMTFPTNGGTYNATSWNAGCSGGAGLCGTATDPSGVSGAAVSIQQQATGKWWNGTSFANASETFNVVSQVSVSGTTWTGRYPLAVPPSGSYLVHVRAADSLGNTNTAANQTSLTFTIGTVGPPAPSITAHPANPTTSDTATFTFTDSQLGVTYQCKLDGGSYAVCVSGVTYTGLSNSAHTFSVQAKDNANNLSSATTFAWAIVAGAPFTIHGSVTGLVPGVAKTVSLTIDNPNDTAIYVSQLTFTVVAGANSGTCLASSYSVTAWNASPPAVPELQVPANATGFVVPVANQPQIKLNDSLTQNQDNCKGRTFSLTFSGQAHS